MKKAARSRPASLADCLGAAQADAERFFGDGPVPRWRPAFPRASRAAGAALAAAATAALALVWVWSVPGMPDVSPAVVVAAAAPRPAEMPIAAGAVNGPQAGSAARAGFVCSDDGCLPAPTPFAQTAPGQSGAAIPVWPADLDAWALDPQAIEAPFVRATATVQRLHNTPVIADETDPTPADENPSDGESGGEQAE